MIRDVAVLGAGPAGLWVAKTLLELHPELNVTVIEEENSPGGITGSFIYRDLVFDYGSHRLHPAASEKVLNQIHNLLGDRLLKRPRNGRIFLEGRFVKFPLKPVDLMFHLPLSFSLGVLCDSVSGLFRRKAEEGSAFSEVLLSGLGNTISRKFYFPYAEKLWGLPPEHLDGIQARRRVISNSISRMLRKVLNSRRNKKSDDQTFFYPADGFGAICETLTRKVEELGGKVLLNTEVTNVDIRGSRNKTYTIRSDRDGNSRSIRSDFVFSTLPITKLIGLLNPGPQQEVMNAADALSYRSMVFCYFELNTPQYSTYDAHYFPGLDVCFSRMSEPGNYSGSGTPADRTGLCFEIPCWIDDPIWNMNDGEVSTRVLRDLRKTGLPEPSAISSFTKRKVFIYPSYALDFRSNFDTLDDYLTKLDNFVSLGRQGLFAHDNTHHTIEMGLSAAECFNPVSGWNSDKWTRYRMDFEKHAVVD